METEHLERSSEEPAEKDSSVILNQESVNEEPVSEIRARLEKEEAARATISAKLESIQKESLPVEVKDKLHKLYAEELEGIDQAIKNLTEALEK